MKKDSQKIAVDLAVVREEALGVVAESMVRVTPPALEKKLLEDHGLTRKQAKAIIRELVSAGELAYTYEFGSTFLELSFNKPVRVSTHVVLTPPGHHFQPQSQDVVIQINPGAAFGDGRHPTSRLAVRGIETVLKLYNPDIPDILDVDADHSRALDIGYRYMVAIAARYRIDGNSAIAKRSAAISSGPFSARGSKPNMPSSGSEIPTASA